MISHNKIKLIIWDLDETKKLTERGIFSAIFVQVYEWKAIIKRILKKNKPFVKIIKW